MRSILFTCLAFILIAACKKEIGHSDAGGNVLTPSTDSMADLVRSPVRPDGSVDSSRLPILTWKDTLYEFGTLNEGDIITHEFRFTNTGTAPLLIIEATSTCGCTIPEWPKTPIPPGSSGTVLVKFNSKYRTGYQMKEVTIFANTYPNQSFIRLTGRVNKK